MSRTLIAVAMTVVMCSAMRAHAQVRPPSPQRPASSAPQSQFRGFADIGSTIFAAKQSFDAVLGTSSGIVLGGGAEVTFARSWFAGFRVSRFAADGERVFLFNGEAFNLGIPTRVSVTPVVLTGGYRLTPGRGPFTVFAGAGVGFHRYRETSDFADDDEDVNETYPGYHLLGGLEYRVHRFVAIAGEAEWSRVPDALRSDPNGVSAAFDEHDLGGTTIRMKVVFFR